MLPCRGRLPSPGLLSERELSWLIAALYNVGVDLHGSGNFGLAVLPLLATATASICSLAGALQQRLADEVGEIADWHTGIMMGNIGSM